MKKYLHPTHAFSLIEVTIALGIAAFCLITVFALLPIGINTNQNAFEQTAAAGIASAIAADIHGTPVVSTAAPTGTANPPSGVSATSRFQIQIPEITTSQVVVTPANQTIFFTTSGSPWTASGQTSPLDNDASASNPAPHYRATITFQPEEYTVPQGSGITFPAPRNKIFHVWILITWPALADPKHGTFPVNFSGSYEATTTLDCY
jgi:type II secretory pathway pseudopilin PulG